MWSLGDGTGRHSYGAAPTCSIGVLPICGRFDGTAAQVCKGAKGLMSSGSVPAKALFEGQTDANVAVAMAIIFQRRLGRAAVGEEQQPVAIAAGIRNVRQVERHR